jgi:LysM repeat protein
MEYNDLLRGKLDNRLDMDEPRYDDYDYDDYEAYRQRGVTSVGLPAGQLALIIGINAVISLIISVGVVLLAGRQILPGEVATSPISATVTPATGAEPVAATPAEAVASSPGQVSAANPTSAASAYVVQPGDTLSAIAQKYAVPIADLMLANGLTNQDFIQVGQELIIPVGGVATPTATFTPVLLPTDTPLPFDPPTPLPAGADIPPEPAATVGPSPTPTSTPTPTLRSSTPTILPTSTSAPFNEIRVVVSEVVGAGDLAQETLVILNQGAGVSLKEWRLEGSPLGVITFPDIFLFSGGSIQVHTVAGENTASDLFLGQGEAAWPPGTTIILSNANNAEIFRFKVPGSTSAPP